MTMDYLTVGPVPTDEPCPQPGVDPDYPDESSRECRVFKRMLKRLFPVEVDVPAYLVVKSFEHDFGTCREVCMKFDPGDQAALDYAVSVEAKTPSQWDDISRSEFNGYEGKYRPKLARGAIRPQDISPEYQGIEPPDPTTSAQLPSPAVTCTAEESKDMRGPA